MNRFYSTQFNLQYYPMITKNRLVIMDSKDNMFIGGKTIGKLYTKSGEKITNPEAYAHTHKPMYNNRQVRGINLNAKTGQFIINNKLPRIVSVCKTAPTRPCYLQKDSLDVLMTPGRYESH